MSSDDNDDVKSPQNQYKSNPIVTVIVLIWIVATIAAYAKAWSCTDSVFKGGDARKIANFLIVPLLGPFWWLFYYMQKGNYCVV